MNQLTRRHFLYLTSASLAHAIAQVPPDNQADGAIETTLEIGAETSMTMPRNFLGLSYESAQLSDPSFFSAKNTGLVEQFRDLSTCGSLRFGGSLSDLAQWRNPETQPETPPISSVVAAGQKHFEWILTTPSVSKEKYAVITPACIKELRGFLEATGWNVIYGLNLDTASAEQGGIVGASVTDILGKRLAALQVGNEADGSRTRTFEDYWNAYTAFVDAVHRRAPHAPFAGPDTAGPAWRPSWLIPFAEQAKCRPVFLSSHFYQLRPSSDPGITAEKLLAPSPRLHDLIETVKQATSICGLPYRMTEVNSCSRGGTPGVSDAYASALWAIDFMLQCAQAGFAGVNFHGGGIEGVYSPIVGDSNVGYTARPITQGMKLANQFAGARFIAAKFTTNGGNAAAHAARTSREILIVVINKDARAIHCTLSGGSGHHVRTAETLSAPGLDSKTGIDLRAVGHEGNRFSLPPYTALLIRSAI